MKKLKNLIAVMAMMSMAAVFTGCGDDDDDNDDDDGGNGGPQLIAPQDEATLTAQNRTYTVNVAGDTNQAVLTFPAAGQYRLEQGGVVETGTISGATLNQNQNTWTLNTTPAAGQDGAQAGVLTLAFNTQTEGAFTFQPEGGGEADTGTFTVTTGDGGTTDGSTDGGNNGGTTDGGGNVTTLTGRTLQLTSSGGGERFDFLTDTTVAYEPATANIQGTYVWDPTNRRIDVTLTTGELFEITIPQDSNTASVVYRASAGGEEQAYTTTYTLSAPQ